MTDDLIATSRLRWQTDTSENAAWDARQLIDDLSKGGRHDAAIEVGHEAMGLFPDFLPLRTAVGWALYRRDLGPLDPESPKDRRARGHEALNIIRELLADDLYGQYSPYSSASLKLVSVVKDRWPQAALELLAGLEPVKLSDEPWGDFPAPRARWHMARTKALAETKQWVELESACDAAARERCLTKDDLRWVHLRRAEALRQTDRPAEALGILEKEVAAGQEWWIRARIAETLVALGRPDEALAAAQLALAPPGDLSFRWATVLLTGRLLLSVTEPSPHDGEAHSKGQDHVQLARSLRLQEGWPADTSLEAVANELGLEAPGDADDYIRRLRSGWGQAEEQQRRSGTVRSHLNEGSGFIAPDDGGDHLYFSRPRSSTKPLPPVGSRVTFIVEMSYDRKKERESERAAKVREA